MNEQPTISAAIDGLDAAMSAANGAWPERSSATPSSLRAGARHATTSADQFDQLASSHPHLKLTIASDSARKGASLLLDAASRLEAIESRDDATEYRTVAMHANQAWNRLEDAYFAAGGRTA